MYNWKKKKKLCYSRLGWILGWVSKSRRVPAEWCISAYGTGFDKSVYHISEYCTYVDGMWLEWYILIWGRGRGERGGGKVGEVQRICIIAVGWILPYPIFFLGSSNNGRTQNYVHTNVARRGPSMRLLRSISSWKKEIMKIYIVSHFLSFFFFPSPHPPFPKPFSFFKFI